VDRLPVIDISRLHNGTAAERRAVAAELGLACRDIGFFYITGSAISGEQLAGMFAASRAFFAQPLDRKQALSIERVGKNRGYVAMEGERLDQTMPGDLKEAFNIGLDLPADHPEVLANRPFRAANAWPDLPGWRETATAYYEACCGVAAVLHRAFALDLGMVEDYFEPMLGPPIATLRLLHYPPIPSARQLADGQTGAGTHTDYGCVTILATDGVPGLQVRRRDGVWLDAPTIPGSFVCNIGDMLMRWSNDVYVSTPHRVGVQTADRYSIAFFFEPAPDAIVQALPSCVAPGEAPKYPPITCAAYLQSRLSATYDHLKEPPE
jgi:isopenicillin N synthase-like dioxygenase